MKTHYVLVALCGIALATKAQAATWLECAPDLAHATAETRVIWVIDDEHKTLSSYSPERRALYARAAVVDSTTVFSSPTLPGQPPTVVTVEIDRQTGAYTSKTPYTSESGNCTEIAPLPTDKPKF